MAIMNSKENDKQRLDTIIAKLRRLSDPVKGLCKKIERINEGSEASVIMPLSLLADICETILQTPGYEKHDYYTYFQQAENIYKLLFVHGEKSEDYEALRSVFLKTFEQFGPIHRKMFDEKLFCSFTDKANYLNFISLLSDSPHSKEVFDAIKGYGISVREYMIGDESYLANLMKVSGKLSLAPLDAIPETVANEIRNVERMNGIYDIDPVRLLEVEKNINEASMVVNRSLEVLKALENKKVQIEEAADNLIKTAERVEKNTSDVLEIKADKAKERVEATLNEFEASEKRAVIVEKDLLLKEVFADAEVKLNECRETAKAITGTTAVEIAALNKDADKIYRKVSDIVNNDKTVRDILKRSAEDEAIVAKFDKLSMLNDSNMEAIGTLIANAVGTKNVKAETEIIVEAKPHGEERILPVSPLLDVNVPFKSRFDCIMKEKRRREDKGELFHEKFDDVLIAVMEDANPYLIGPSGCGKTYMVKQIASLLDMEYTDIGYINEEYDILGFVNAAGRYTESNFYRCYKYGHIAFCDELDNGNSRATVKLNSFLTNSRDSSYSFPGGERVMRHPGFRIISAGNTSGDGADVNYNAREKIEESVQQRLLPIYIDYDNRVEKAILKDYPDWFDFVCLFRNATDKWSKASGIEGAGILTTRDTVKIKRYLTNNSFSNEKIMDYEFIQTKSPEYLEFLDHCMKDTLNEFAKAGDLYELFHSRKQTFVEKGRT